MRAWAGIALAGSADPYAVEPVRGASEEPHLRLSDPDRSLRRDISVAVEDRDRSGGLFGKGWMEGTQTQLRFLPTQHTDFIFSVLAEEWGFVGSAVALGLYLTLLLWGLQVARRAGDGFGALIAVGVVGIFFWPALINVAMVLGLFPVIGVALPLFSYGGSAMIACLVALGLLLNVSMRRRPR